MTRPPEDAPTLWLKQVPRSNPNGPAIWSTRLIADHETVARLARRPAPNQLGPGDTIEEVSDHAL
jgi:hypothetical protein